MEKSESMGEHRDLSHVEASALQDAGRDWQRQNAAFLAAYRDLLANTGLALGEYRTF